MNGEKTKSKNEEISSTSHVESVATTLKAKNTKSEEHAFTMVVPVYISTNDDKHNEVLTYALLDTQSDTTFILDEVADDLIMSNYEEVQLELITMSSTESKSCKNSRHGFQYIYSIASNVQQISYTRRILSNWYQTDCPKIQASEQYPRQDA